MGGPGIMRKGPFSASVGASASQATTGEQFLTGAPDPHVTYGALVLPTLAGREGAHPQEPRLRMGGSRGSGATTLLPHVGHQGLGEQIQHQKPEICFLTGRAWPSTPVTAGPPEVPRMWQVPVPLPGCPRPHHCMYVSYRRPLPPGRPPPAHQARSTCHPFRGQRDTLRGCRGPRHLHGTL